MGRLWWPGSRWSTMLRSLPPGRLAIRLSIWLVMSLSRSCPHGWQRAAVVACCWRRIVRGVRGACSHSVSSSTLLLASHRSRGGTAGFAMRRVLASRYSVRTRRASILHAASLIENSGGAWSRAPTACRSLRRAVTRAIRPTMSRSMNTRAPSGRRSRRTSSRDRRPVRSAW